MQNRTIFFRSHIVFIDIFSSVPYNKLIEPDGSKRKVEILWRSSLGTNGSFTAFPVIGSITNWFSCSCLWWCFS